MMLKAAVLSPCRTWRYRLERQWDTGKPTSLFIMLNPSTADGRIDDPTIRRCIAFARGWGMGRLIVCNLFAFRSTDPRALLVAPDPVGPDNDAHIASAAQSVGAGGIIVCAWGASGSSRDISHLVPNELYCLGVTKAGHPRHPLYLRRDTKPQPFATEGEGL